MNGKKVVLTTLALGFGGFVAYQGWTIYRLHPIDQVTFDNLTKMLILSNEEVIATYRQGCDGGMGVDCGELGYIEDRRGNVIQAKGWYERGCQLGDAASCKSLKSLGQSQKSDPLGNATVQTLVNGLRIVSLEDSGATNFRMSVVVNAGRLDQPRDKAGIAHLTEHAVFRDGALPPNVSYLDKFQSRDGEVNARTTDSATIYDVTIASDHSEWLTSQFTEMFSRYPLVPFELEKSKREVIVERQGLGWFGFLKHPFFHVRSLEDTEFGIPDKIGGFGNDVANTKTFTENDVSDFYDAFYRPSNMTVYLYGNFDSKVVTNIAVQGFGRIASRGVASTAPAVKPVNRPYVDGMTMTIGSPDADIGFKFWDATITDAVVFDIYMFYLGERVMREFRSRQGVIYSAFGSSDLKPWGVAKLTLDSKNEDLFKNIDLIREVMNHESQLGTLSDQQIKDAIALYKFAPRHQPQDQKEMFSLLKHFDQMSRDFNVSQTRLQIASALTPDAFRQSLRQHFKADQAYLTFKSPISAWEMLGFLAATMVVLVSVANRRILTFANQVDKAVKQKFDVMPRGFDAVIMSYVFMTCMYLIVGLRLVFGFSFPGWTLPMRQYDLLLNFASPLAIAVGSEFLTQLGKLMVAYVEITDRELVLKSTVKVIARIPIESIASATVGTRFLKFDRWWIRAYLLCCHPWRKGVIVTLKSGKVVYFIGQNHEKFIAELDIARHAVEKEGVAEKVPQSMAS